MTNFNGRLLKLLLFDPPIILTLSWNIIEKLLDKETSNKIQVLNSK